MERLGVSDPLFVTHPDYEWTGLSAADQEALADQGAIVEKCYIPVVHGDATVAELVEGIDAVGAEHCVLSTDHGQPGNRAPSEAYATFCERLLDAGLSKADLEQMAVTTPRDLLVRE